ncbi:uncharacterized protein LOC116257082 [Nymphaea colorata]|nr:uncharacterized protein LOC116257082 [Nymphaea colorata]
MAQAMLSSSSPSMATAALLPLSSTPSSSPSSSSSSIARVHTLARFNTPAISWSPRPRTRVFAKLGGGEKDSKPAQKKFITREEEPEQYWQTAGEREGENPMKTPLPYIIIFGMSTPFVILAIAFANGWIKVPVR